MDVLQKLHYDMSSLYNWEIFDPIAVKISTSITSKIFQIYMKVIDTKVYNF